MKKVIAISILLTAMTVFKSNAQVYSPQLAGMTGFYNIFYPYGYYQGQVYNGDRKSTRLNSSHRL